MNMSKKACCWILTAMCVVLGGLMPATAQDFASGVQARNGNASPSAGFSNIDEYTFQDEQINIDPDDGTIKVLRVNQKNLVNDYVTKAIPVTQANQIEMLITAKAITAKEGGWAEVFFNKADGTKHVVVVCPPKVMPYVEQAIKALDKPYLRQFDDGSFQTTYRVRHRPASVVAAIAAAWAPFNSTTVDDRANELIHSGEEVWSTNWHKAANMIDMPTHEADLEVKVYKVQMDDGVRMGLDYVAWKNGPGRALFNLTAAGYASNQSFDNQTSIFDPFVNTATAQMFEKTLAAGSHMYSASFSYLMTAAYVDFLATKNKAKVVNETTIRVNSGHPAFVDAYTDVLLFDVTPSAPFNKSFRTKRILEVQEVGGVKTLVPKNVGYSVDDDRRLEHEKGVKVGMSLELFPSIALESMELEIVMDESVVSGQTPEGLPIVSDFAFTTEVRLTDGQPLVLTGTRGKSTIKSKNGAPLFSSVPLLGYFAGGTNENEAEEMLVVTITPKFYAGAPNAFEVRDWEPGEVEIPAEDYVMSAEAASIKDMALGNADVPKLAAGFGFDQWLLDGE